MVIIDILWKNIPNSAFVRTDRIWATSSSPKFKVLTLLFVVKSWFVSAFSCIEATFKEVNWFEFSRSFEGEALGDVVEDSVDEVVDSVDDFLCLDSHNVIECLLRIFSVVNFARSLATVKKFSHYFWLRWENNPLNSEIVRQITVF